MVSAVRADDRFTFHYVSISTCVRFHNLNALFHLHSTMYLFQPCFPAYCASLFKIYIPLCIYFNFHANSLLTFYLYLHSTMYLFQPYHFRNQQMRLSIYIPLCIYFNLNQFTQKFTITVIYIPLCIYFNKLSRDTML